MKKYLIIFCFAFCFNSMAQNSEQMENFNKNELKINALGLVLGNLEVSYERILNEESGIGTSTSFALLEERNTRFTLSPYYRYYFGEKPAQGFFAEGFGMLNVIRDKVHTNTDNFYQFEPKNITNFAFGIGLGGKWVSKRGVVFEIHGGVGRNLFYDQYEERDYTLIGKVGLTAGYRF